MDFDYKKLSFGQIISHVFPGFVFLLLLVIYHYAEKGQTIFKGIVGQQWNDQGAVFIIFIFLGTIAGVLIDALRHLIDEYLLEKVVFKRKKNDWRLLWFKEEYQLKVYAYFVCEQVFYYYEAYGNLIIATIPVYWIIPLLKINIIWSYAIVLFIHISLLIEARNTYKDYFDTHNEVIDSFKSNNDHNDLPRKVNTG